MTKLSQFKSLFDNIPDEEYFGIKAMSYSMLSRYQNGGPKAINKTYEGKNDAFLFGTIVDEAITSNVNIEEKYYVADDLGLPEKVQMFVDKYPDPQTMTDDEIINGLDEVEFRANWSKEKRLDNFKSSIVDYIKFKEASNGKVIVTLELMNNALKFISAFNESEVVRNIIEPSDDCEVVTQAVLGRDIDGTTNMVKCKFDFVVADHVNKTIRPVDLKSTGEDELMFIKSFFKFNYWIQAGLYSEMLRATIGENYFDFTDYKILPFTFIVINKDDPNPTIWEVPEDMDEKLASNYRKSWRKLLHEVDWHLTNEVFDKTIESTNNNNINIINL